MDLQHLLSVIRHLSTQIDRLESKINDLIKEVEALQEEYSVTSELTHDSTSEESPHSTRSAPAAAVYGDHNFCMVVDPDEASLRVATEAAIAWFNRRE